MKKVLPIFIVSILLFHCGKNPIAGGGVETNNTISGILKDGDGEASNAKVSLIPIGYNPFTEDTSNIISSVLTEGDGTFMFSSVAPGSYNIIAIGSQDKSALLRDVSVIDSQNVNNLELNLKENSVLSILLDSNFEQGGVIFINGTDVSKTLDSADINAGTVSVNLPPEKYTSVDYKCKSCGPTEVSDLVDSVISLESGLISTIGNVEVVPEIWSLIGGVLTENDIPVSNTKISLYSKGFNPFLPDSNHTKLFVLTDSLGKFNFKNIQAGNYNVIASEFGGKSVLLWDVVLTDSQLINNLDLKLQPGGSVQLSNELFDGNLKGTIYFPGTEYMWIVDLTSADLLYEIMLPPNDYKEIYYVCDSCPKSSPLKLVENSITVGAATQIIIGPYYDWTYRRKVILNGNSVTKFLTNFPMLVRLSDQNFDFNQTKMSGGDLRFENSNGLESLNYEIERWDGVRKKAEIWVQIDTVRPNDSNQYFTMVWGNDSVLSASKGPDVFSAISGFASVWHLGQTKTDTTGEPIYLNSSDVTKVGQDFIISEDVSGLIGLGNYFGFKDYIKVDDSNNSLKIDSNIVLSAWIKADTSGNGGGEIISMGNNYGIRINHMKGLRVFKFSLPRSDSTDIFLDFQDSTLTNNQWHFVVGVISPNQFKLYVDGEFAAQKNARTVDFSECQDLIIGKHGCNELDYNFKGFMDELTISTKLRSSSWIKLSYDSQKENSSILRFE